jgi:DNA-binding MarR family transcriptional regulator
MPCPYCYAQPVLAAPREPGRAGRCILNGNFEGVLPNFCILVVCIYIYLGMSHSHLPEMPCMCGSFRRTARALTSFYEDALRPLGLRATQLTILQVLARAGEVSQGRMGEMLAMDSTSLTRTLAIMRRRAWVAERRGKDHRERLLRLSRGGAAKLKRVTPVWDAVQARLSGKLGKRGWKNLLRLTKQVTELVSARGGSL